MAGIPKVALLLRRIPAYYRSHDCTYLSHIPYRSHCNESSKSTIRMMMMMMMMMTMISALSVLQVPSLERIAVVCSRGDIGSSMALMLGAEGWQTLCWYGSSACFIYASAAWSNIFRSVKLGTRPQRSMCPRAAPSWFWSSGFLLKAAHTQQKQKSMEWHLLDDFRYHLTKGRDV